MMDTFEDIKSEVVEMAQEREKLRIVRLKQ
jgi:hypothetical protein